MLASVDEAQNLNWRLVNVGDVTLYPFPSSFIHFNIYIYILFNFLKKDLMNEGMALSTDMPLWMELERIYHLRAMAILLQLLYLIFGLMQVSVPFIISIIIDSYFPYFKEVDPSYSVLMGSKGVKRECTGEEIVIEEKGSDLRLLALILLPVLGGILIIVLAILIARKMKLSKELRNTREIMEMQKAAAAAAAAN